MFSRSNFFARRLARRFAWRRCFAWRRRLARGRQFASGGCRVLHGRFRALCRSRAILRSIFRLSGAVLWLHGMGGRIRAGRTHGPSIFGCDDPGSREDPGTGGRGDRGFAMVAADAQRRIAARGLLLLTLRRHGGNTLFLRRRRFG